MMQMARLEQFSNREKFWVKWSTIPYDVVYNKKIDDIKKLEHEQMAMPKAIMVNYDKKDSNGEEATVRYEIDGENEVI